MDYNKIDAIAISLEDRFGRLVTSALVSLILMSAAALYVRPAVHCTALGNLYSQLAANPFGDLTGNYVGFRILTPLISYLIGLRGDLIIVTNMIIASAFIALIYIYFRQRSPRPGDALVAATVMTFSMVTLSTIYYGGYCDSLTYMIIFLMYWFRSKRFLFYILFFLGMLNRESIAFLLPWFIFMSYSESNSKIKWFMDMLLGYGICFALLFVYREWMLTRGTIAFTTSYYLTPLLKDPFHWFRNSYTFQGLGLFTVFKALWIFPAVALVSFKRSKLNVHIAMAILILLGSLAQLFIAYDSSRMLSMSFMVMIILLEHLFKNDTFFFRSWVVFILILNLFVPQLYTASHVVETMHSTFSKIFMKVYLGNEGW
ncbi:MAG: hypothetical protein JRI63_13805 [Deltaproteobacteria bacterium]|nr:hypothetical protein [Deltaproteobacteria bacterium]